MTRVELIAQIRALRKEDLGSREACKYTAPCIVGALMTPEERELIVLHDAENTNVKELGELLPKRLRPHKDWLRDVQHQWDADILSLEHIKDTLNART